MIVYINKFLVSTLTMPQCIFGGYFVAIAAEHQIFPRFACRAGRCARSANPRYSSDGASKRGLPVGLRPVPGVRLSFRICSYTPVMTVEKPKEPLRTPRVRWRAP